MVVLEAVLLRKNKRNDTIDFSATDWRCDYSGWGRGIMRHRGVGRAQIIYLPKDYCCERSHQDENCRMGQQPKEWREGKLRDELLPFRVHTDYFFKRDGRKFVYRYCQNCIKMHFAGPQSRGRGPVAWGVGLVLMIRNCGQGRKVKRELRCHKKTARYTYVDEVEDDNDEQSTANDDYEKFKQTKTQLIGPIGRSRNGPQRGNTFAQPHVELS